MSRDHTDAEERDGVTGQVGGRIEAGGQGSRPSLADPPQHALGHRVRLRLQRSKRVLR
jgi:hypothetical protein